MPFSCATKGRISDDELIFHQFADFFLTVAFSAGEQVGDVTSSALARRSSEDSVGVAFSFSILET